MVPLLLLLYAFSAAKSQAPGDEDDVCVTINNPGVNQEILMHSHNYRDLTARGGPWIVVDEDDNNNPLRGSSTPTVAIYLLRNYCMTLGTLCWCHLLRCDFIQ